MDTAGPKCVAGDSWPLAKMNLVFRRIAPLSVSGCAGVGVT